MWWLAMICKAQGAVAAAPQRPASAGTSCPPPSPWGWGSRARGALVMSHRAPEDGRDTPGATNSRVKARSLAPGWLQILERPSDLCPQQRLSQAPRTRRRWALSKPRTHPDVPVEPGDTPCPPAGPGGDTTTPARLKPAAQPLPLTCLQSEAMRLRLLVEMVRVMGMPANFRLLFPRMEFRERLQGWGQAAALGRGLLGTEPRPPAEAASSARPPHGADESPGWPG